MFTEDFSAPSETAALVFVLFERPGLRVTPSLRRLNSDHVLLS